MSASKVGRVPIPKNSKSAFDDDVKRPTEFFCCRCGKYFSKQGGNFPTSKSVIYKGNNGYLPICKTCLCELFMYYAETLGDEFKAAERVCSKFDIYYSQSLFETVSATTAPNVVMTTYVGRVGALGETKTKSYDDNITERESVVEEEPRVDEEEEHKQEIVEKGKIEWGLDLSADDYEYLDKEFADWNERCDVDSKARESMVREICVLKYLQNKALMSGDVESYNKLSATMQKTLTTAELTPRQVQEKERASEIPLGVLIKRIEEEEPIPEPLPEFKDVDGIQKYIRIYFIGHLMKMLGLKNKYSEEYEAEMNRYLPDISTDVNSDDSEDIYDYLMRNGFAEEGYEEDLDDYDEPAEGEE